MPKENNSDAIIVYTLEQIIINASKAIDIIKENKANLKSKKSPNPIEKSLSDKVDFGLPIKPFVKKYCNGLSGPKKFTLVLAYLTKGDGKIEINLDEIKKTWNKNTSKSLLGYKFNRFYSGEAKIHDWVESKKKNFYNLRPSWKNIFTHKNFK